MAYKGNEETIKGLLEIESPTVGDFNKGLGGLMGNPMFGMGMGLMESAYDPKVNPFKSAMSGLQAARTQRMKDEEEERMKLYRAALAQAIGVGGVPGAGGIPGAGGMPGANPHGVAQMPQRSPVPPPQNPFGLNITPPDPTEQLIREYTFQNLFQRD